MKKNCLGVFIYWLLAMGMVGSVNAQTPLAITLANKSAVKTTQSQQKLIDIVLQGDQRILKSKNESVVIPFMKSKNEQIFNYLTSRYPQYGTPIVDKNDVAMTLFGLVCAMYEANDFKPLKDLRIKFLNGQGVPPWLSCALSVLGESLGVTELVSSLGTFSYASTWTLVKFVVKKYVVGWLGTAVALYSIAHECF